MKESALTVKSYSFAVRIVGMFQHLTEQKREFVLSKQCLRSGTSIGALVRESAFAESKPDFIHKLTISAKEANETSYWLSLLKDTDYIDENAFNSISKDCDELIKLLTTSIKTSKSSINK
jgi:four helix bundle protein